MWKKYIICEIQNVGFLVWALTSIYIIPKTMRGVLLPHLHRINEQIRGSTVVLSPPRRRVGTAGSGSGWMGNSRLRPVGGFSSRFLPVVVQGGDETACSCIIGVIASYSWVKISPFDFYRRGKLRHQEKCIMYVLHLWFCARTIRWSDRADCVQSLGEVFLLLVRQKYLWFVFSSYHRRKSNHLY